ncbi:hypothetical protein CR532_04500 (plasmid) [Candidatus Borreliella tachyglossi]|uniref:Lipoprotein n=1 Tax=Candidatus Borreliella tachyglossi TaxID=1964448 RepID=A0A2S1LYB0_9SPIR|nr:hypothetical protein [Candidatus Borreliella tachyglossi]AWG43260.1 hypothetical protein CR532_04500 [Candidatus Borreliella tachyglossi]
MRYINIISILLVTMIVSCKAYDAIGDAIAEIQSAQKSAESIAEDIGEITGLSVDEVKALSPEELANIVEKSSGKAQKEAQGWFDEREKRKNDRRGWQVLGVWEVSDLIKDIKGLTEKFGTAFKALLGEGYGDPENIVKKKIDDAVKYMTLLDKLVGIVTTRDDNAAMEKLLKEFGESNPSFDTGIQERWKADGRFQKGGGQNDKHHIDAKKCVKGLMGDVETLFSGIKEKLDKQPADAKYKVALDSLKNSAKSISTSSGLIKSSFTLRSY